MSAVRSLLGHIVDYAGLFPPASLDMTTAMRNYLEYRREPSSWMLGRFVAPVARLEELRSELERQRVSIDGPVAISATAGADVVGDMATVRAFNRGNAGLARIETLEARLSTPEAIEQAASEARGELELFAEVPADPDPKTLIATVARAGVAAKIRTGGTTPDAFPSAASVVRFIRRCLEAGIPFKATAGLHHPLRAEYPLTYEPAAPRGVMFGFVNVFVAAALLRNGVSDAEAERILSEGDRGKFEITSEVIRWEGHLLHSDELRRVRDGFAISFGSCSFREPVDELHELTGAI
jgi:hypothetical protein